MKHNQMSLPKSFSLLRRLLSTGQQAFTLREVYEILPSQQPNVVRDQLSDMVQKGLLIRLKGGSYHIIPFDQSNPQYLPNWHLVGAALAAPHSYYIGFYSALDLHGLITQPSLVEQVVTMHRILPKKRTIKNVRFDFITFSEKHFFGFGKHWISDSDQVFLSDIEKTLIDSLYRPKYSGGIVEIAKALDRAKSKIDVPRLARYLEEFCVQAVRKRLGFLLDRMSLFPELQAEILSRRSLAYTPLDTSLPNQGRHDAKWRILDNADVGSVLEALLT